MSDNQFFPNDPPPALALEGIRRLLPPNTAMSSSTITSPSPLNGSCFCGAVKYALSAPPVLRTYYHCTQCQRLTGISLFRILTHTLKRFVFRLSIHPYRVSCMHDHDAPVDTFVNPLRPLEDTHPLPHGVTIASRNSRMGTISVWCPHFARDDSGRVLRWNEVRPTAHIFYGTAVGYRRWSGKVGRIRRKII